MAEIRLTTEQQKVVDARECNLLVAAAAGSGKTAVLVKRIIKKLLDEEHPQDIDRLLIVTFTNAAAAEMRERIGAAVEGALEGAPENRHLQRQLMLLHSAKITTIHSFCLSVIREFFHVIPLDPGFRIGDEAELSLLRSDVFDEVLEKCYESGSKEFLRFSESFGGVGKDAQLIAYAKSLYELSISQLVPEEWLDSLEKQFDFSEGEKTEHPVFSEVMHLVKETIWNCRTLNEQMYALCLEADGPAAYTAAVESDRELLDELWKRADSYDAFSEKAKDISFARLSTKKQEASEEKKQMLKDLRDTMKKLLKGISENYFYASKEELITDMQSMAPAMRGLLFLTRSFMERYAQAKREKNLLDFSDLEQMALRILVRKEGENLVPTKEARVLSARFDEIMIDEYQDSNRIQETILGSISGIWEEKPNIFMVGDVKQSIYRFRMACPELFMEKYRTYREEGDYRKIDLHKNFRSRSGVLGAINVLFAGLMRGGATEVEYDEAAALYYGADYPEETKEQKTELWIVPTKATESMTESEEDDVTEGETEEPEAAEEEMEELSSEEKTLAQAEAMAVAERIRKWKTDGFLIGGKEKQHRAEYRDMVVLLRTMSGWSEQFLEVFSEQGIPAYADTSSGYFKSFEIRKTLDFLRILDNPKQDIPFAAVLHSPIAGMDAEELALLKTSYGLSPEGKPVCMYTAARKAAQEEPEGKAAAFFALYDRLSEEAMYLSIHELLEHFYRYSGFLDVVTVMPGGEKRRGNLEMLLVKAKQYERTSFSGLYDFIRYIDKLIKYEVDFGEAQTGDGGNMVRIMSIHKSKGLEFPIVFLCGMEKKFNRRDMQNRLIFHAEGGLGTDFIDPELRTKAPTLMKKVMVAKKNDEMIAEELRVLYVAMTRAKEKLILVGAAKQPEKRVEKWQMQAMSAKDGLISSYIKKASTYFDFVCPLVFSGTGDEKERCLVFKRGDAEFSGEFQICRTAEEMQGKNEFPRDPLRKTKQEILQILSELKEEEASAEETAKEIRRLLKRQTEFSYPYEKEAKLPVKVTVSEVKRLHPEETEEESTVGSGQVKHIVPAETEPEDSYPEFLKEKKKLSGSDRGTLYHRVMELLPFTKQLTKEEITEFLDKLEADGKIGREERAVISPWKVYVFTRTELGKRMHRAALEGKLHREQPFVLGIPAGELYPESEAEELLLVQGIMDAYFEEEDGLVLVDYKTDFIKEDAEKELSEKYRVQLRYYRKALEKLKHKPVKEVWIYSIYAETGFLCDTGEYD